MEGKKTMNREPRTLPKADGYCNHPPRRRSIDTILMNLLIPQLRSNYKDKRVGGRVYSKKQKIQSFGGCLGAGDEVDGNQEVLDSSSLGFGSEDNTLEPSRKLGQQLMAAGIQRQHTFIFEIQTKRLGKWRAGRMGKGRDGDWGGGRQLVGEGSQRLEEPMGGGGVRAWRGARFGRLVMEKRPVVDCIQLLVYSCRSYALSLARVLIFEIHGLAAYSDEIFFYCCFCHP
ncbi:hypothetical protein IEQ34_022452 [Dendrobium chrysotoxum]|uniref:Uncharacterized protein n=1 Tax=Dendrobium chrysotoxum TaxID=161865 RepID=A0AAV7FZ09_DENCH|nr:hypothetical protein IEQ34_022452 [Dendrobium chrysotoxum]